MKTLIVYASKYGCAADCAGYLRCKLPGDAVLSDINKVDKQIELKEYDAVVIGGSVYIGKVSKKLRAFCENNLDVLKKKRIGLFLCCAQTEQADKFFADNFLPELISVAKTAKAFGSEARLDKMTFFDKAIIKAVTKGDFSSFKVSFERIEEFAEEIASL